MRVTTISTAALCSLGVLAAYGVGNKVAGTPQSESPKEEPTIKPSVPPKLDVNVPISQTIAPPESLVPPSLSVTRNLAKERQQREAQLAQNLAKVSVPSVSQQTATKLTNVASIHIPDVNKLPIDQIVAQSVGSSSSATLAKALPQPIGTSLRPAAEKISLPPVRNPNPSNNVSIAANVSTAAQTPAAANQVSSPAPAQTADLATSPTDAAAQPEFSTAAETTTPIATTQSPSPAQTAPVAVLQTLVQSQIQSQIQPQVQQSDSALAATSQAAARQVVAQTVASTAAQPIQTPLASSPQPSTIPIRPATLRTEAPVRSAVQPAVQPVVQPAVQPVVQPIAQSTSTGAGAISATNVDETYTLGSGDRLSLRFFNAPEYNGDVQVSSDGTLNLPVVGNFSVAGMTLKQAEAEIAARYQSELRYSVVTVSLVQSRPLQVAIVGEVQQPGSYTLGLEAGAQFPGIVKAIQAAGGTTQAADLRNVQVQRSSRSNPNQTIAVNLVDLLQSGNLSQDLRLRDGDRIVIPTATTVDFAEATQFSASNFAANPTQPVDVAIVGDVFRPGAYKMGGQNGGRPTVTQAIQLAGGVKPTANVRQIQIRRATRSGAPQLINVDMLQLLQSGNLTQDLALQQGDQITIATATTPTPAETALLTATNLSPEKIRVNVAGEVKSPGAVEVSASSTLNQAILAAGGLNNRATREIELIRLEPNGTLSRRTIKVDIKQGFNTSENPLLMSNDIVVVGRSGAAQLGDQLNQITGIVNSILQLVPFRPSF